MKDEKALAVHLDAHGLLLEAQLSSPLMAIFANLVPLETSLRILDRFLLQGGRGILNIVKSSFRCQKAHILSINDAFELQMYLKRQVYLDAMEADQFLPIKKAFLL